MNGDKPQFVWVSGSLVPWAEATVHAASPVLLDGLTVYEELRCHAHGESGAPLAFRLGEHIDRLERSCKAVMLDVPFPRRKIVAALRDVVKANAFDECCVRMAVTYGGDAFGQDSVGSADLAIVCWNRPDGAAFGEKPQDDGAESRGEGLRAVDARISSWRAGDSDSLGPRVRTAASSGVFALARQEAVACGADEAVVLDGSGRVCQSTRGSVFVVRDGVLSTPPLACGAYDSVMRDAVLNMAMDMDIPSIEEQLTRFDLYMADELFFADDLDGIVSVSSVDGRRPEGRKGETVTEALSKRLAKASVGELPEYAAWVTELVVR